MNKMIVAILGILGIIILFYMFPSMLTGLKDMRTDPNVQNFNYVTTAPGVTNGTVTLSEVLWKARTNEVNTITSNNTLDTPSAQLFANDILSINGLEADSSRNLTVDYNIAALEDYEGLSELTGLAPLLLFVGFLGVILALIWRSFAKRGE